jgi:hypothetical protein
MSGKILFYEVKRHFSGAEALHLRAGLHLYGGVLKAFGNQLGGGFYGQRYTAALFA